MVISDLDSREFLTPLEFGRLFRIGRSTVYAAVGDGSIPSVRVRGVLRIPVAYVRALLSGVGVVSHAGPVSHAGGVSHAEAVSHAHPVPSPALAGG